MERIESLIKQIEEVQERISNWEVEIYDYENEYRDCLDETWGTDILGSYSASYVLEQVDPTAYRCGLIDYVDSLEVIYPLEWDDEIDDLKDELFAEIDDEIEILEDEINNLEYEEGEETPELDFYEGQIQYLKDLKSDWE